VHYGLELASREYTCMKEVEIILKEMVKQGPWIKIYHWFEIEKTQGSGIEENTLYHVDEILNTLHNPTKGFYILEAILFAYPQKDDAEKELDILTWKQYKESKCSAAIVIFDGGWFEVYAKDPKNVDHIYEELRKTNPKEMKFYSKTNMQRVGFYV